MNRTNLATLLAATLLVTACDDYESSYDRRRAAEKARQAAFDKRPACERQLLMRRHGHYEAAHAYFVHDDGTVSIGDPYAEPHVNNIGTRHKVEDLDRCSARSGRATSHVGEVALQHPLYEYCVAYHPKGDWHDCWQVLGAGQQTRVLQCELPETADGRPVCPLTSDEDAAIAKAEANTIHCPDSLCGYIDELIDGGPIDAAITEIETDVSDYFNDTGTGAAETDISGILESLQE